MEQDEILKQLARNTITSSEVHGAVTVMVGDSHYESLKEGEVYVKHGFHEYDAEGRVTKEPLVWTSRVEVWREALRNALAEF